MRRIEELQQHENMTRFADIVNLHAAATVYQDCLKINESCRSHEDKLETSY